MSKSNTFENDFLKLVFQGTAIVNLADNASSSPLTNLYVALHTADPGEAGDQTTSESAYSGYARVANPRSTSGFTVTNNVVTLHHDIEFPSSGGSGTTVTHASIGVAASGASKILFYGELSTPIAIATGVVPIVAAASTITES
jgi:hypothetical protein